MVWSEYVNEQYYEQVPMDETEHETPLPCEPLVFEDWVDWYEPHLSNMWRDFTAYRQDTGINHIVGNALDYWDFVKFLYNTSDKRAIPIE